MRTAVLVDASGTRFEPGSDVPQGRYRILADFGGKEANAGEVNIVTGRTTTLRCSSLVGARCVPR